MDGGIGGGWGRGGGVGGGMAGGGGRFVSECGVELERCRRTRRRIYYDGKEISTL